MISSADSGTSSSGLGSPPAASWWSGSNLGLILFAVPVLGFMLGGIYQLPVDMATKGREPWNTLGLLAGLAASLCLIAWLCSLSLQATLIAIGIAVLWTLVARFAYGPDFHSNIERFGIIHACMCVGFGVLGLAQMVVARDHQGDATCPRCGAPFNIASSAAWREEHAPCLAASDLSSVVRARIAQ